MRQPSDGTARHALRPSFHPKKGALSWFYLAPNKWREGVKTVMSERPFNPEQFTESARRGWDSAASGWKKWAPTIEAGAQVVNDRLVDMAGLEPGHKALDIATGYGEPLMTILRRVGPTGHVVATDLSLEMIELARERAAEHSLSNATFYPCNGESLEIPETDFDAALCRWGLMLMADPDACLRRLQA